MSFLSPGYLLFFPATVLLYFLLPRPCKNLWLLAASWFFYLCAGPDCFAFLTENLIRLYFHDETTFY